MATAYLGKDVTEDASKVVRDAVRTRPCMYTVRREDGRGPGEEGDSGPTDIRAHAPERTRVGVRTTSKDGEAGIAHGRDGGTAVERSVAVASLKHPWDNKMRLDGLAGAMWRRAPPSRA